MSKLEELRPNASVQGILPNCLVSVVNAQWFGSEAVELTYKDPTSGAAADLPAQHRIVLFEHMRALFDLCRSEIEKTKPANTAPGQRSRP
jgi:hypothetical protein